MRLAQRRLTRLAAPLLALSLLAAACGDDDLDASPTGSASDAADDTAATSGDVVVSGSSTVEPIAIAVAEKFAAAAPDVDVAVDGPGTGDGFQLFCDGETDISDASRPISPEEIEGCEANGVEFVELEIAFDGIAVMANPANDDVECLTFADIYALVGPESQGVDSWDDAEALARELGSGTDLPDRDLFVIGPGEESGTYDSFVEVVIEEFNEDRRQEAQTRPDYQSSADDNTIIQGIEGDEGALGWVGFAFAEEAGDGVRTLQVDHGDGCVAPTAGTIADGSYPISRPLFVYVNTARAEQHPAVAAYVDFLLSDEGISSVEEVGYIALPEERFATTTQAWEARATDSRGS